MKKKPFAPFVLIEHYKKLPVWGSFFVRIELEQELLREDILRECIIVSGNRLALKIWLQLLAYSSAPLKNSITPAEKLILQTLLTSIQMGYSEEAVEAYEKWLLDLA